jgi:serine protease AprX
MKKIFTLSLLAGIIIIASIASKPNSDKLGPCLKKAIENSSGSNYIVYVYLKDKGPDVNKMLSNPLSLVTQRSLDRRAKVLSAGQLVDFTDVPIYQKYLNEISLKCLNIRHDIKWLNSVSLEATKDQVYELSDMNFVDKIELVERYIKNVECDEQHDKSGNETIVSDNLSIDSLNYGTGISLTQITQIKVNLVHDIGVYGQGIMIGHFDAGYTSLLHPAFTTLPMNIYKKKDFHTGDTVNLAQHSHGEATLSLVGGYVPGQEIGPAFGSTYILCRTEVDPGERWYEMDHWIAAAQWVDSLGADVITSSLGYLRFDLPDSNYTWQNMDGHTLPISKAAALAAHKGIVVSNSAGNNGSSTHNTLGGPADADSIITVGSVDITGDRSSFSSIGPTTDVPARIKPDVMVLGEGNKVASGTNDWSTFGSGTSYSCPLNAGVCALMLSANKNLTPLQVRGILRYYASNHLSPNNNMGWGIIDAQQSVDSARRLDNVTPTIIHTQPFTTTTDTGTLTFKARIFDNGIIRNTRSMEAPRIYYRKNTGNEWSAYTSANFTSVNVDTFYFRIPGSSINTQVEYYFATQDIALPNPLASTLPAGGSGINPPGTTAPSTQFAFIIDASSISTNNSNTPDEYKLFENYPNPFNPVTNIRFLIKESGLVTLKVFDVMGRLVTTLMNQKVSAGDYTVKFYGTNISSGVYFYRIESGNFIDVKKMCFVK